MSPEENAICLSYILPNLAHGERLAMVTGMREAMPAEVFSQVLTMLNAKLNPENWFKLCAGLDIDPSSVKAQAA